MSASVPQNRADAIYQQLIMRQPENWVEPGLERVQRLLDYLDNPQRSYDVIHVTGTNGKTSTSRMIDSLLRAHGFRTGLFTSPHLEHFSERIVIDGEAISEDMLDEVWRELSPLAELVDAELEATGKAPLTFFETLTALAFLAFSDAPVDVAVIEVGMGGSWDCTNTADGRVAVFTPIDLDHAAYLGDTLAEIATVKAGIIKENARVVSAEQQPEVAAIIRAQAERSNADLHVAERDFSTHNVELAVGGQRMDITTGAGQYSEIYLPTYGHHQVENFSVALTAVECFLGDDKPGAISEAILDDALSALTTPGRLQMVGVDPFVFVDAAHNPHAIRALVVALQEIFDVQQWGVVFGTFDDKDSAGMIAEFSGLNAEFFVTAPHSDRAVDAHELAEIVADAGWVPDEHAHLSTAAEAARAWAAEDNHRAVLVTGSVVLVGETITMARNEEWKSGWHA